MRNFWLEIFLNIVKVIATSTFIVVFFIILYWLYRYSYFSGYREGQIKAQETFNAFLDEIASQEVSLPAVITNPSFEPTKVPPTKTTLPPSVSWGGPELWEAVNKERQENGVNPLDQRDELCTIASIRLNELLALGSLDNHEGFSNMTERRPDLVWIFEKYSTVAEFLAMGGASAGETVSMWENTLGHSKLLTAGEYVWGCIYAQNSIAVAITAF
jgi:uncharacterized protein YkwD